MPWGGGARGAFHAPYVALVASLTLGQTDADLLARAKTRFEQGKEAARRPAEARRFFGAAADDLHELHRHGYRSAGLYLHLGNAALLADQVPHAIWAYHQGLRLDPGHQGVREHLAYARGRVRTTPTAPPSRWPFHLSAGVLFLIAALAYIFAWLFAVGWLQSRRRRHLVALVTCSLLAALAGWAYVDSVRRQELDRREPLVVINEPTSLHRGNGVSYPRHPDTPTLPPGLEARQLHRRGSWLLVRLESGQVGWVRAAHVIADEPAAAP